MLRAEVSTRLQYVQCSRDVRVDVSMGVFKRIPDAGLRCQVYHAVRPTLEGAPHDSVLDDVPSDELEGLAPCESIETRPLEPGVVVVVQVVQPEDLVTSGHQSPTDRRADEAGGTCHQDFHERHDRRRGDLGSQGDERVDTVTGP